ncbi:MAG: glycosyltransferase family 39 protein [Bacteroidales bacterium]|nr:glycosyltransferase family 39 protein [Bacteroidales bacterium]
MKKSAAKIKSRQSLSKGSSVSYNFYIVLVLIFTFIVYANSLDNDFVNNWDDDGYILNNQAIKKLSAESVQNIFSSFHMGNYHPLTTLSYALEFHFFKLNPKPYHVSNLLLHICNVFLVFVFLKILIKNRNISLITALLFAIHPLHVESVSWISERKDVLYTFFYLLSLIMFLRFSELKKIQLYLASLLFFVLSLLSKSAAVSLPLVLLICVFFKESDFNYKRYLPIIPFFVLSLIFGIVALKSQGASTQYLTPDYTIIQRFFVAHYALLFYLYKFFLPINLSAFYPHPVTENGALPFIYYASPVIIWGSVSGFYFLLKDKKVFAFGLLFFLFTIFTVIQFIPVGGAIVAERYTYVPYIGFSVWIAYIADKYLQFKGRISVITLLVLVIFVMFFTLQSHHRNKVWANGIVLFDDVIEKHPDSFYAYHSRGIAFYYKNEIQKALEDYDRAIALNDSYGFTLYNRGLVHNLLQNFEKAAQDYTAAIALMPNDANAYNDRAIARLNLNNFVGALEDLNQ